MKNLTCCFFICFMVFSCLQKKPNEINQFKYKIYKTSISLDSSQVVSSQTAMSTSLDKKSLFIFDHFTYKIYEYDLKDLKLKKIRVLNKKVINGKVMGFQEISSDVFGLYIYKTHSLLYYSCKNDNIIKSIDFTPDSSVFIGKHNFAPSLPYVCAASPLIIKDSFIIGTGYYIGELISEDPQNRTICSVVNIYNQRKKHATLYPKSYWIENWGGVYYRSVYCCYNSKNNSIYYSFPADHKIYKLNNNWQLNTVSKHVIKNNKIKSIKAAKNSKKMENSDYIYNHYVSNISYGPIIFDEFNNCYYRILELPVPKKTLAKNPSVEKECLITVFDSSFNYLGKFPLPQGLSYSNFFCINGQIYFLNLLNTDEDVASFSKIKIARV